MSRAVCAVVSSAVTAAGTEEVDGADRCVPLAHGRQKPPDQILRSLPQRRSVKGKDRAVRGQNNKLQDSFTGTRYVGQEGHEVIKMEPPEMEEYERKGWCGVEVDAHGGRLDLLWMKGIFHQSAACADVLQGIKSVEGKGRKVGLRYRGGKGWKRKEEQGK